MKCEAYKLLNDANTAFRGFLGELGRYNLQHLIITSTATGRALGGVLYAIEGIEEMLHFFGAVERVENIEIGNVVATANGIVLGGFGVNRLKVAHLLPFLLHVSLP